jgi:DsbC/DsbD-like thiol-disulfide interchange protein
MESSVKFVRLNTGEDLISDVSEIENDDNRYYVFHNPMKVVYQMNMKNGGLTVSLMQWVFLRICDEQNFVVYSSDVVTMNKPTDDMEDYYWQTVEHFKDMKDTLSKKTSFDNDVKDESEYINELEDLLQTFGSTNRKLH